jgi:hypothetical protein
VIPCTRPLPKSGKERGTAGPRHPRFCPASYSLPKKPAPFDFAQGRLLRFLQGAGVVTHHSFRGEAHLTSHLCPRD